MPRSGGDSDKLGNHFESLWTLWCALDVVQGYVATITVEALEVSEGVEFCILNNNHTRTFCSVKRQKQGGDWSIADLTRKNETGRSILHDLVSKVETFPNATVCFVSATGANQIRELTERSRSAESFHDFKRTLSASLSKEFLKRIVPICRGDESQSINFLKSLEIIPRGHRDLQRDIDRRIDEILYSLDDTELDSSDLRRWLMEMILENLGKELSRDFFLACFGKKSVALKDWKSDDDSRKLVEKSNSRFLAVAENELINASHIAREEVADVVNALNNEKSRGVLLVAPGGYGKSCVLAQVVRHLTDQNHSCLCLRLDSLENCISTKQVGRQLDLRVSPAILLAAISGHRPCTLVVDQLDALSIVSGKNTKLWQAFEELVREAEAYPFMKVIVACRDFDLQHDSRLRTLEKTEARFHKVVLGLLSEDDVKQSIKSAGNSAVELEPKKLEILRVPFHLLLFLQGSLNSGFSTIGDLFNNYWNRKRKLLEIRMERPSYWADVIDSLVDYMSDKQLLFAPEYVVDAWANDAEGMTSEHVLVYANKEYRFFHESFFDYAFARKFSRSGRSVKDLLLTDEQHLFRRGQVRQILSYFREHEFDRYLENVEFILESNDVRFHINRMVASGFRQVRSPRREEWLLLEKHFFGGDLSRYVPVAIRGHSEWFQLLDQLDIFVSWLSSGDDGLRNAAIWLLEASELHNHYSKRIAEIIQPFSGELDEHWLGRLRRIMSWGNASKSLEMTEIFLKMVQRGDFDSHDRRSGSGGDLWSQLYSAKSDNPKFVIDVAATWFDRAIDQHCRLSEDWNPLGACALNNSHSGAQLIVNAADVTPLHCAERFLPCVVRAVRVTEVVLEEGVSNRVWPWRNNSGDPFRVDEAILLSLRRSLQSLATHQPDQFRTLVEPILTLPHKVFAYLLLRAWTDNPEEFADECAKYLCEDPSRFRVGYGSYSGRSKGNGVAPISRMALLVISSKCSQELFFQMEDAIIGYTSDYEKKNPGYRGLPELLVLRSLERSRLSKKALLRVEELERKFPSITDEIVPEDVSSMVGFIGSPLSENVFDKMSDQQWISAMRKYSSDRVEFGKGGAIELSRRLSELARADRQRFVTLVHAMPEDLNPIYFDAILNGLIGRFINVPAEERQADREAFTQMTTESVMGVIERLHKLPGRPCGSAIVSCINELANRQLRAEAFEILHFYSTSDPDPQNDIWLQHAEKNVHPGDPYSHGINCVRGQAAEAVASLLYEDNDRIDILRPTVQALVRDPVISVRCCALNALLPLLKFERDEAVRLFLEAATIGNDLLATNPYERFLHYAVHTHYAELRGVIQTALKSDIPEAIEIAARQTIVAELNAVDVGELGNRIRAGNEHERSTAVCVYAKNLGNSAVGDRCAKFLAQFLYDESSLVREQVSGGLYGLSGERLLELEPFLREFIKSPCFPEDPDGLLRSLEESDAELPTIVAEAAERILEFVGAEGTSIAYAASSTTHSIATLVIRQYEQTRDKVVKTQCLDLIDKMERAGYYGIAEELGKIER